VKHVLIIATALKPPLLKVIGEIPGEYKLDSAILIDGVVASEYLLDSVIQVDGAVAGEYKLDRAILINGVVSEYKLTLEVRVG